MLNRGKDRFQGDACFLGQFGSGRRFSFSVLHGDCCCTNIFSDAADNFCNHAGLIFRPFSQTTNICCHSAEALSILTGHSCLNSGVECQAVRLMGDTGNNFHDVIDLSRTLTERLHLACRGLNVYMNASHAFNGFLNRFASALCALLCITCHVIKDIGAVGHLAT